MKGSPLASIFQEKTAAREGSSTIQVAQHCGGAGHLDQSSVPDTEWSPGLHLSWDSLSKNPGEGCHALL